MAGLVWRALEIARHTVAGTALTGLRGSFAHFWDFPGLIGVFPTWEVLPNVVCCVRWFRFLDFRELVVSHSTSSPGVRIPSRVLAEAAVRIVEVSRVESKNFKEEQKCLF